MLSLCGMVFQLLWFKFHQLEHMKQLRMMLPFMCFVWTIEFSFLSVALIMFFFETGVLCQVWLDSSCQLMMIGQLFAMFVHKILLSFCRSLLCHGLTFFTHCCHGSAFIAHCHDMAQLSSPPAMSWLGFYRSLLCHGSAFIAHYYVMAQL